MPLVRELLPGTEQPPPSGEFRGDVRRPGCVPQRRTTVTSRVAQVQDDIGDGTDVERGKQIFMRVGCYQCHGREAQGASTGPRLGPNPLPLAAFTRAVRTPRNEMPPYSTKLLSDAELADVHAFVAARPRPHQLPR